MGELRRSNAGVLQQRSVPVTGFHKAKRARFLDVLAATCNATRAAQAAGIDPRTAWRARARDGEFARLWAAAVDDGLVRLEEALVGHALGQVAGGENPGDERTRAQAAPFNPDLALKVLQLRARAAPGGSARAARPPTAAEVDAALMKRLQEAAARTAKR